MCKKLMFLISLVLLLGLASNVSAEDLDWTNAYLWTMTWDRAANWNPAQIPTSGDEVTIKPENVDPMAPAVYPLQGPAIDSNAWCYELKGPSWDSDTDQVMLVVSGGNLDVSDRWTLKENGSGTGTIEMIEDAYVWARFRGCEDGTTIINMRDDSAMEYDNDFEFVDGEDAVCYWNVMDNARVYVDDRIRIADEGAIYLTISGNAHFQSEDDIRVGDGDDGYAEIVQTGGTLIADGDLRNADDGSGFFDISGGTTDIDNHYKFQARDDGAVGFMYTSGDADITVGEHIIVGEGEGTVTYEQTGGSAWADGDLRVTDDDGDNFVNISGGITSVCNVLAPRGGSGAAVITITGGLLEVRCGGFEHDSDNWSLDICGDGLIQISGDVVNQILLDELAGNITACGGCGGRGDLVVDYNETRDGYTTIQGVEDLCRVYDPSPVCGYDCVPAGGTTLSWTQGETIDPTYHVFLSDCYEDVEAGLLPAWKAAQTGTTYETGPLCVGETYYWRVDSVDDCNYCPGQVWSFIVCPRVCIEEFEDYDNGPGNPIWETWEDGCGDANGLGGNGTGSCVYSDHVYVCEGDRSMRYYYDCSGQDMSGDERDCNYAEATSAVTEPQDWLESCAKALTLCFKGNPDNDAGPLEAMYFKVTDTASESAYVYYGTKAPEVLADMQDPDWQPWAIALDEFVAANPAIDLTSVASMSIGFGDYTNCHREKGGYGVMHIDQICLYPCRCIPKYTPDIVDLNDDCIVDWLDIKVLGDNWLEDERCDTPPY